MKKIVGDITILHMCTKNHNHMRYSSWDTKWDSLPLQPTKSQFKKNEKTSRYVIILNLCNEKTRSYDVCLLRYGVFAQTFFCHFRPVSPFLPHYWPQKLKFGKNVKKHLNILSFYTCVPLIKIIWCLVPEIWTSTDRIFLSSRALFCPFTPLTPWKWKQPWIYYHFTQVYQKSWSSAKLFQRYGTYRM